MPDEVPTSKGPSNAEKMSALGLGDNAAFVALLLVNVVGLAWIVMLLAGALWHTFDVGSPISFWASVPIGAVILVMAFVLSRRRMR
jgi:hypothetical protein